MHKHDYLLYLETDLNPTMNQSLGRIAAAELAMVLDAGWPGSITDVDIVRSDRATALSFACDVPSEILGPLAGQLSSSLALFERTGGGLQPVPFEENLRYDSAIVAGDRSPKRTNPRFTRAVINIALTGAEICIKNPGRLKRDITVLDPLCGRGTTLNWALAYGCDAIGIDADRYGLDQNANHLVHWAARRSIPHLMSDFRPTNPEHRHSHLLLAPSQDELDAGDAQSLELFNFDAGYAGLSIANRSVDIIVTDLPLGVGIKGPQVALTRREEKLNPPDTAKLAARLIPTWKRWLRPGGVMALAWNTKRTPPAELHALVEELGFKVMAPPFDALCLAHRVRDGVERDVVFARI